MRVNNFNLFLLKEALLESVMHSSTDLRNILSNIRYKESGKVSEIAQTILSFIEQQTDIKTGFNALDLSPNKNDDIGFVPDNQFQKLLADDKNPWDKEKSYTRIGRMVRQLLKDNGQSFLDKDIEQFVNAYKSQWDRKHGLHKKVSIVSGKDIQFWYSNRNYYDTDKGTLGSSCMSSDSDNHYMQIYSGNPDKISLVILTEDDKLTARALLWKLDSDTNGCELYLDRIYTMQDSDRKLVKNWVMENIVKGNNSKFADYHDHDDNTLDECRINLNTEFSHYPYADTMSYLYKELKDHKVTGKGILSNKKSLSIEDHINFTMFDTGGGISCYSGHIYIRQIDSWYLKSDCVYAISSDLGLYRDYFPKALCEFSQAEGNYYPKDELIYSEAMKDWILKEDAIEDSEFGFILKGYVVDAITDYTGNKNMFGIYQQLISNDMTNFTIEKRVKDSNCFTLTVGSNDYKFDEDLEINGFPIFLTINSFRAVDDIPLKILKKIPIYYRRYEGYYITRQDANYYNIKVDDEDNEILTIKNLQKGLFYSEYLKNDVKVNKKYENSYKKYITSAHNYLKDNDRKYSDAHSSGKILDKVRFLENYIVDSAIEGFKKWVNDVGLSDPQFRRYFDGNFDLREEDLDKMMKLRELSNIFCVIDSNKDESYLSALVNKSISEYILSNENLDNNSQIERLSYACGRFAQNLENGCRSITIDIFKEKMKRYVGDEEISNYTNLLASACRIADMDKVYKRIQKKLGKLF